MNLLRTPFLARQALGLPIAGEPAVDHGICVCCGGAIKRGDLVSPLDVSAGFSDGRRLRHTEKTKPFTCQDCSPFFRKKAMMRLQKVIITESGAFPIGQGANRAWFLINPPKPPFSVLFSDAKLQHLVWAAPITWDQEHWFVQMGARTLPVRRKLTFKILQACEQISAAYFAEKGKQLKSPYAELDPELGTIHTGAIRDDVEKFCGEQKLRAEIELVRSAGSGELWALNALIYKRDIATQPDALAHISLTEIQPDK